MIVCTDCKEKIKVLELALQNMSKNNSCVNCKANKICDKIGDCVSAHIKFAQHEIKVERELENEKRKI